MQALGDLFLAPQAADGDLPQPLALASFVAMAAESDYVLLGEAHTSPCDHATQALLIEAMAGSGLAPVLGLEMVGVDLQPVLDRFNAGEIAPQDLARALDWDTTWGHPFELYLPIFQKARELGLPVYSLNVPPRVIRAYRELGEDNLAPEDRALLPRQVVEPSQAQVDALQEEMERHSAMAQERGSGGFSAARFFRIQSLWDSMMAQEAIAVRQGTGRMVVILAGQGHVEFGWGIKHRIMALAPDARVLLVVPWRGDPPEKGIGDVLAYCPLTHRSRLGFVLAWDQDAGGALVQAVESGSQAEAAGVMQGDVVVAAMGKPLESMNTLHEAAVLALDADNVLRLTVLRDGVRVELEVKMDADGDMDSGG